MVVIEVVIVEGVRVRERQRVWGYLQFIYFIYKFLLDLRVKSLDFATEVHPLFSKEVGMQLG